MIREEIEDLIIQVGHQAVAAIGNVQLVLDRLDERVIIGRNILLPIEIFRAVDEKIVGVQNAPGPQRCIDDDGIGAVETLDTPETLGVYRNFHIHMQSGGNAA